MARIPCRSAPDDQPDPGQVPGESAPGREGPVARRVAARPDRSPRTPAQVADVVGLSAVTVRDVLHRWNADGPAGLTDRRAANGSESRLSARCRAALFAALKGRPPDGGPWTGPKVARYVADRWGIAVGPVTGWRWLVDLGFTLQVPRPSHPRSADRTTRRGWKKTGAGG